jgi:multiple sugar transport system permease protein
MIPGVVTLIPSYILIREIGWVDTYAALIAPGLLGNAFGTFLMRQFFLTLPGELEEAARIDGAGRLRIFATIAVPLSKPAVATLAVLTFVNSWNNFLWPLIVINSDNRKMLTVGLSTFQGQFNTHWGWLMAGSMLSLLPMLVVFFAAQRYFVQGIQFSGFK